MYHIYMIQPQTGAVDWKPSISHRVSNPISPTPDAALAWSRNQHMLLKEYQTPVTPGDTFTNTNKLSGADKNYTKYPENITWGVLVRQGFQSHKTSVRENKRTRHCYVEGQLHTYSPHFWEGWIRCCRLGHWLDESSEQWGVAWWLRRARSD